MNVRIDIIPSGYFIVQPKTVGSSDEEAHAWAANAVPLGRATELASILNHALIALQCVIPAGRA